MRTAPEIVNGVDVQRKCPSRPLSYHRTVMRGTLTMVRIMGGLLATAYLRTVFLWMPTGQGSNRSLGPMWHTHLSTRLTLPSCIQIDRP